MNDLGLCWWLGILANKFADILSHLHHHPIGFCNNPKAINKKSSRFKVQGSKFHSVILNLIQDPPEDLLYYGQEILNQVQDDGEWDRMTVSVFFRFIALKSMTAFVEGDAMSTRIYQRACSQGNSRTHSIRC